MTDGIEVFKLGNFSSRKNDDNIEKESDEINRMDMSYEEESDERYKIGENKEDTLNTDI